MAIRVDADTATGMLSDIETELDSEDRNLDSDDSVSSREEYDDSENDDNVSDENEATLDDSRDERVVMRSLKTPQPPEVEQHRGGEGGVEAEGLKEAELQLQVEGEVEAKEGVELEELEE